MISQGAVQTTADRQQADKDRTRLDLRGFLGTHGLFALALLFAAYLLYQELSVYLVSSPPFVTLGQLVPGPYSWLAYEVIRLLFLGGMLTWLGWWRQAGIAARAGWDRLPLLWLPALTLVASFRGLGDLLIGDLLYYATVCAAVGLYEESLFRGLVLRALLPRGRWLALAGSSVLFGLWHVGSGQPEHWFLVVQATMAGVGLGAIRLRCGSVWPCVVWHAAYNFLVGIGSSWFGSLLEPMVQVLLKSLPTMALLSYGLLLMRRYSDDGSARAVEALRATPR